MDFEAIKKAVEANPALATQVATWAATTEQGKTILGNHSKMEVDKAIKAKTSEIYQSIDNDMFEVLGVRKDTTEKTYDFLKKIAKEYKTLKDKKGSLDTDETIKGLKAKIKEMEDSGEINKHWKGVYDSALEEWKRKEEEFNNKYSQKEKEYFEAQVEADLKAGLSGIQFMQNIPQSMIDTFVDAKKASIMEGAKIENGKVVYYDKDGKPKVNSNYAPMNSKEIWGVELKDIISTNQEGGKGGGATTNPITEGKVTTTTTGEGDKSVTTTRLVLDKSSFTTKREFNEVADAALRKEGLAVNSKEYQDAYSAAYKEYEVKGLALQ